MTKRVRVAEAKARLSTIIDEVLHGAEHYVVERRGRAVIAIVRVEELERIEAATGGFRRRAGALAFLGAWGDVDDAAIDAFLQDVYDVRERDTGRLVSIEP